jgi:hypothetical protein
MSATWNDIALVQPTNGQQVWVRRYYFDNPFLMYWRATTMRFTSLASDLVVSGAGTSTVNGSYNEAGDINGFPLYITDAGTAVINVGANTINWAMGGATIQSATVSLYNGTAGPRPTVTWSAHFGTAPLPIVTLALTIPWYLIVRWRPM